MDRSEWPSRARLQTLREEGLFVYSRFTSSCFAAIIIFAVIFAVNRNFAALLEEWSEWLQLSDPSFSQGIAYFAKLLAPFFHIIFIPICLVYCGTLLVILLQSRFFFRWRLVGLDFSRVFRWPRLEAGGILARIILFVCIVVSLLSFVGLVIYLGIPSIFGLLNSDLANWVFWLNALPKQIALWLIPLLMFGAAVSWILSRFLFMLGHRMTREEIRQELEEC